MRFRGRWCFCISTKNQNAKISDADKRKLVVQLEDAIASLQEQYDKEVTEEEHKVQD